MKRFLLADRQGITRAGLMFLLSGFPDADYKFTEDKGELINALHQAPESVVVLDYTLFDINDADELLIFSQRFCAACWVLFSEDLSTEFVRMMIASGTQFSILLKESPLQEIREALTSAMRGQRFICQRITEQLLVPETREQEPVKLTRTETEVLKDIALGMTTREIAEKRFSSFHTVNTHRKNIFRKISVNNVHEATKYALRAGLVDSAEYYI